jgi:DNA (cytosine-5)-methyltransferase 1
MRSKLLVEIKELLTPVAKCHTPSGTEVIAVVDQWIHAIATDSQFFCNTDLKTAIELKNDIIALLINKQFFSNRDAFYELVFDDMPLKPVKNDSFKFIDLFAGIGGVRLGFQNNKGSCVFSSEFDKGAQKTYKENHGEYPFGDITKIDEHLIPDHDVLLAGFPCQPFSNAGVSARSALGKQHGFLCETQGTLFFDVLRVVNYKRPKVIFLENVRNLVRHDKGKTFETIRNSLINSGYNFSYEIIDSSSFVPQRRVRCYMVGIRKDLGKSFKFPNIEGPPIPLKSILEDEVDDMYTISDKLWQGHINRTKRNIERGTGFTAHTADLEKPSKTIVARYGKDGKECLIPQENKNPRMLTQRECARLQGFPEEFIVPLVRTPAYKQFGNSVVVPLISELANKIKMDIL